MDPFAAIPGRRLGLWVLVGLLLSGSAARAYSFSDDLEVYGYLQSWVTLFEQMEEADALFQHPSGDVATTQTSGFSLHQVRGGMDYRVLDGRLGFSLLLKAERNPAILNAYASVQITEWLRFRLGQFKIPTTYAGMILSRDMDFIQRTQLAAYCADYALSRTVHPSSLFYNNASHYRDMGLGVDGELPIGIGSFRFFLMVGNGLGANLYIGGGSERQFILTNLPQFFSGGRLELADLFGWFTLGGHASLNRHTNMVFNSGRVVYDLDRLSWSVDAQLRIPNTGLALAGMFAAGKLADDYDADGRVDLDYSGWDVRAIWGLSEVIAPHWRSHRIELTGRYESYESEWNEVGAGVEQTQLTLGMNYQFEEYAKVMLNYMVRWTDDPSAPDLADDAVLLSLQLSI